MFYECVARYLENDLDARGVEYLKHMLSTTPARRSAFVKICLGEVLIRESLVQEPAAAAAADTDVQPEQPSRKPSRRWWSLRTRRSNIAASVGLLIGGASISLLLWRIYGSVAHLEAESHATWDNARRYRLDRASGGTRN